VRFRRSMLQAGVASLSALRLWRGHQHLKNDIQSPPVATELESANSQLASDSGKPKELSPRDRSADLKMLFIVQASLVLSGVSVLLYLFHRSSHEPFTSAPHYMYPAGLALIVALVLSSLVLLWRWRHGPTLFKIYTLAIFTSQLLLVIIATIGGTLSALDLPTLFSVMAFGLCGMGIGLCVVAMWMRGWLFAESAVLGLLAIVVTLLCLPGILFFTRPLQVPEDYGYAYLFATGTPTLRLSVNVENNPLDVLYPRTEIFTVRNGSNHPINWALLLDYGARFRKLQQVPSDIKHQEVHIDGNYSGTLVANPQSSDYDPGIPAQLFAGTIASDSSERFYGTTIGYFKTSTIDRTAVYLPTYSQGSLAGASPKVRNVVISALGGTPAFRRPEAFTIRLTGGFFYFPLESVRDALPALDPGVKSGGLVHWTGHMAITNPQYTLFNQSAADEATDGLFVFAVFLGVAGASILASLQSVIKILLSRTSADTSHEGQRSRPDSSI
jgi:hypothetical protein